MNKNLNYLEKENIKKYIMTEEEKIEAKKVDKILSEYHLKNNLNCQCIGFLGDCGCFKTIYIKNKGYVMIGQEDRGRIFFLTHQLDMNLENYIKNIINLLSNV